MREIKGFNFNEILKDWDFTYNQMSAGHLECKVHNINFDNFLLYREHINTSAFQVGGCQNNSLNLGFFSNPAVYMGKQVRQYEIISLSPNDEILLKTPENSLFYSLSIPLTSFKDEMTTFSQFSDVIHNTLSSHFSQVMRSIFDYLFNNNLDLLDEIHQQKIKKDILDIGYQYFYNIDKNKPNTSLTREKAVKIVKKVIKEIYLNPQIQFSIEELCLISHTSRRTLYHCFDYVTGQSPSSFIKSLKLNAVHQQLKKSSAISRNIYDIATDWGFWHFSHFSADYKKMFGELPSQTQYSH